MERNITRRKRREIATGGLESSSNQAGELLAAVADPEIRLDSIGVFVVAGYVPREAKG